MKIVSLLTTIVVSLCLSTAAWGQQALSSTEVQQILQQVTSQPRKTWITVGTVTATHQEYGAAKVADETTIRNEIDKAVKEYQNSSNTIEKTPELKKMKLDATPFNVRYKLANEYSMNSTVTVKYDNGRFYWEINVTGRNDSIKPADWNAAGNYMAKYFDLSWNQRRIFTWDGQEYTTYSASGKQATVDAAGKVPHVITGPLTAGLIPWGYGRFSTASLDAAQVSASKNKNGSIDMTIQWADSASASLTLDPTKAYAVTKATLTNGGGTVTYTCAKYQQVAGTWVPYAITIERRSSSVNDRLPTSEQWNFTSVSTAAPAPGSFRVPLAANTLVEYASPLTAAPALYYHSNTIDARNLLVQRLAFAAAEGSRRQNCATVAVQEAATELGKTIPDSAATRLVGTDGRTSMYDLKQLVQSQGLYCRAVQTDLATLRTLQGVKAILHIPGKDHFVMLSEVDDRDIWLIDLSDNKFYYRQSVDFFSMDWSQGTALLLSNRPIPSQPGELSDTMLAGLTGGAGYTCTRLLQSYGSYYCDSGYFGCDGTVIVYYERWGCESAPSGSCTSQAMTSSMESPCDGITDECTISGEWFYNYMSACG